MYYTASGREIIEEFSDSPVTRVRIKKGQLVLRYAKDIETTRQDDIYDTIINVEKLFPKNSPTVRIKILSEDDLNTIQCEIGSTDNQTKLIKERGVDY